MNKAARDAGRRMLPVFKEIDDEVLHQELPQRASCKRGCHSCCYLLVSASLVEMLPIAEYLLTSDVWKPRLEETKKKLKEQAALIDGLGGIFKGEKTSLPYLEKKIPCVFLKKNGDCAVYKIRPSTCRTYYVVSPPEDCDLNKPAGGVMGFDVYELLFLYWRRTIAAEGQNVPPLVGSMQHMLLIALELLEREPEQFRAWLKENPQKFPMDLGAFLGAALCSGVRITEG